MKTISRVILSAILLVLTGVLVAMASFGGQWFFPFYQGFSQKALGFLGTITSPLPFALWEVLALLLILWAVYTLVRCFVRHRGFLNWLSGLLLGACTGVFLFVALWGLGHWSPSVGDRMDLEVREYTEDELYDAAVYYAQQANLWASQVARDEDGVADLGQFKTLAAKAGDGYGALAEQYDCFTASTGKVKRLIAWKLYSYFGVTGIFVPFTGESSVNPDTFAASLPFTMCHELAHRQGYPAEDDANFCAYLACEASEDPAFRYSGAYSAFIYCYNALYEADRDRAAEVWDMASEQVKTDCRAANAHYDQYEGKVQEAAQAVNDAYLKAFQEEAGVQSYGAVADYLIAWYQQTVQTA